MTQQVPSPPPWIERTEKELARLARRFEQARSELHDAIRSAGRAGLSQRRIVRQVNISQSTVCRIITEEGKRQ